MFRVWEEGGRGGGRSGRGWAWRVDGSAWEIVRSMATGGSASRCASAWATSAMARLCAAGGRGDAGLASLGNERVVLCRLLPACALAGRSTWGVPMCAWRWGRFWVCLCFALGGGVSTTLVGLLGGVLLYCEIGAFHGGHS